MFIGQQYKAIAKIPKGLYVKIARKDIQSLRDFGNYLTYCSYKHKFPSGMGDLMLIKDVDNGQGFKPAPSIGCDN